MTYHRPATRVLPVGSEQRSVRPQAYPPTGKASFPAALANSWISIQMLPTGKAGTCSVTTPLLKTCIPIRGVHTPYLYLRGVYTPYLYLKPGTPCHTLNFSAHNTYLADSYSSFKALHKVIFSEKCSLQGNRALQEVWVWILQAFSTDYVVPNPSPSHDCVIALAVCASLNRNIIDI